jgi:hypothetical protein
MRRNLLGSSAKLNLLKMNVKDKRFLASPDIVVSQWFTQWRRMAGSLKRFAVLAWLIMAICPCGAEQLVVFDFSQDLSPRQQANRITTVTPVRAALSVARQDGFTESVRANTWQLTTSTNYYRFSFAIEAGYVVDLENVQFDFMSQKAVSTTNGPTQYNVVVGVNGAAFESVSGGWKTMATDGAWHRGVTATHGGVVLSNLSGGVTIALAGMWIT